MMKITFVIIASILFSSQLLFASAEPVFITISEDMDDVIFDGRWTHFGEWKRSSLNTFNFGDGKIIYLRSAHQDDFIYFLVDFETDTHVAKGSDRATICLDTKNDKQPIANQDDFCFLATLGRSGGIVLQGGSPLKINSHFKKISSPENFIGVGDVSDINDRYSGLPHASYEFKIPVELFGRSDVYGFFVSVYDSYNNRFYNLPNIVVSDNQSIPSPNTWSELVSPDKSLPEFHWLLLPMTISFVLIFCFTKFCNRIMRL